MQRDVSEWRDFGFSIWTNSFFFLLLFSFLGKMELGVKVTFTPTYPAEVPMMESENLLGLLDSQLNDLSSILNEMVPPLFSSVNPAQID